MNGRIYDPKLGRMLSPDPVTQTPENGQNYNRYTYANNNPLRYTDPSGFSYTQCGAAVAAQGGNGVANVGCAVEVYGFVETALGAFGFGGNGCDKTCKERTAAHNWCKAQSACLAELRANTREKFRKRSALVILEATLTGQSYYYENGRAHLGDNTTGTGSAAALGELVGLMYSPPTTRLWFLWRYGGGEDRKYTDEEFGLIREAVNSGVAEAKLGDTGDWEGGTYQGYIFYGDPELAAAVGQAYVIFDTDGTVVGVFDRYDFGGPVEYVNILKLLGAEDYNISYGPDVCPQVHKDAGHCE